MLDDKTIQIYTSRDEIRNELIEELSKYLELEGIDLSKSSFLSYLINVLSGLTSNLLFYSTSIYKEFFLTKAIQKESVINLASMIGYTPPYAIAANCKILISIPVTFSSPVDIVIPGRNHNTLDAFRYYADTIVFTQDDTYEIHIESSTDYNKNYIIKNPESGSENVPFELSNGNIYFNSDVTQIELQLFEFNIQKIRPYEFYMIDLKLKDMVSSIDITINNTDWISYNSLFLIPSDEKGYVFRKTDSGGKIFFGNGIVGEQPPSDTICYTSVYTTKGSIGNVIAGSISNTDRLYVEDSGKVRLVKLTVINPEPGYNGKDEQDIDEIRASAIAKLRTRNRLVSQYDFDDIKEIITTLPVTISEHILKRSDITSEIYVYMTLVYKNEIVPTRSCIWEKLIEPNKNLYEIYTTDIINIDGTDYYSIYNIKLNYEHRLCEYYYMINEVERPLTITDSYKYEDYNIKLYTPKSRYITITTDNNDNRLEPDETLLYVELHYTAEMDETTPLTLDCEFTIEESQSIINIPMVQDSYIVDDKEYTIFKTTILLSEIPNEEITFKYTIYTYNTIPEKIELTKCTNKVTIVKSLSSFMSSYVEFEEDKIRVYDVPVIKKSYYIGDNTNSGVDINDFNTYVLEKISNIDITEYKMTSSFIILKFSNTTGIMDNMLLNDTTKWDVISINPTTLPVNPINGNRYIVTNINNNPWNLTIPSIVEYSSNIGNWINDKLDVNDIIYVSNSNSKVIFNGTECLIPITTIPLELKLIVWKDRSISQTDAALISNIKEELINELSNNFGYDKNLFISDINKIVRGVAGVKNCYVKEPKHDIFFDFKSNIQKSLTSDELIQYVPNLIWITNDTITIEVV